MASGTQHLRFRCTECGNCCRDLRVPLTQADLRRLVDATGQAAAEFVEWLPSEAVDLTGEPGSLVVLDHGEHRVLMTLAHRDGACRSLGADERCLVYAARPASCRLYPFAASFGRRGGLRRLRLLSGTHCEAARDGENDPHALRVADEQRWAEHRSFLAQIQAWNRSQGHRSRLGYRLQNAREFLAFLGFPAN
ncbi:MAG: YkgJ family cysteine cluster protein [Polyangiaceae bacterium]